MSESESPLINRIPQSADRGLRIVTQGTKTSWPLIGTSNVVMISVTIWMSAMICIRCCRSDASVWVYMDIGPYQSAHKIYPDSPDSLMRFNYLNTR
ncbi:hypothetical protein M405DRAFT_819398 [Rhizopogon salebrosus TDB-379]|nr:hypothetical protein M405DRAFT_819398 [Rhizopogon salebrosus TDB-379]